ncbi:hypothetical protein RCL_jg22644.t1 [Rhizophagus clarus]|uniref:Uncharacterized protein n=1 Tax=Rhizophagus clarus TaxID=94130 RepID=A0A8H3MJ46_9GLOM|nr:hypothetical protein RCL_jg22644.t1 [Rhizophagus clarus]
MQWANIRNTTKVARQQTTNRAIDCASDCVTGEQRNYISAMQNWCTDIITTKYAISDMKCESAYVKNAKASTEEIMWAEQYESPAQELDYESMYPIYMRKEKPYGQYMSILKI